MQYKQFFPISEGEWVIHAIIKIKTQFCESSNWSVIIFLKSPSLIKFDASPTEWHCYNN